MVKCSNKETNLIPKYTIVAFLMPAELWGNTNLVTIRIKLMLMPATPSPNIMAWVRIGLSSPAKPNKLISKQELLEPIRNTLNIVTRYPVGSSKHSPASGISMMATACRANAVIILY